MTGGLREGEQVIVSGLMRVRPGMTVRTNDDPEIPAPPLPGVRLRPRHRRPSSGK